jgi:hypothetical protein
MWLQRSGFGSLDAVRAAKSPSVLAIEAFVHPTLEWKAHHQSRQKELNPGCPHVHRVSFP